ncbi:MAG: 16S rRNA (guanine(966)-N(2))-methyltransferase RsmD [Hyphomicrobiales bacterium]
MRIVAGRFKGRVLVTPSGMATRPTSDRLRETLFNVLAHAYDDRVTDARVLDLFAGSGALGLEALSRGAVFAQFVEEAPAARGAIKDNIDALGVAGITKVYRRDATHLGPLPPDEAFSLVFCDPPYGKGLAARALHSALKGGWLAPRALIIVEEKIGASDVLPQGVTLLETRDYGETNLTFAEAP